MSPNEPWAATGQKDPKDEPGKGEDLPYVSCDTISDIFCH